MFCFLTKPIKQKMCFITDDGFAMKVVIFVAISTKRNFGENLICTSCRLMIFWTFGTRFALRILFVLLIGLIVGELATFSKVHFIMAVILIFSDAFNVSALSSCVYLCAFINDRWLVCRFNDVIAKIKLPNEIKFARTLFIWNWIKIISESKF